MEWLNDFEIAKTEASRSKKIILLQFEMENCGGCKRLYETTYTDQKVQKEINEWFVPLKLDIIKDKEVRRPLGAYWTPAVYFLDQNGNSYYHFNGYLPPVEFRIMLRLGIAETIMPRGRYDEIISVIQRDLDEFRRNSQFPKLLVQMEIARYIKTKDNSPLRNALMDIQKDYPDTLEAKMYYWKD